MRHKIFTFHWEGSSGQRQIRSNRQLDRHYIVSNNIFRYQWRGSSGKRQIRRIRYLDRIVQINIIYLEFNEEDHQENIRSVVSDFWTDIIKWDERFRSHWRGSSGHQQVRSIGQLNRHYTAKHKIFRFQWRGSAGQHQIRSIRQMDRHYTMRHDI